MQGYMGGTRAELYVHLVWATWDRLPLLHADTERHIYRCLESVCTAQHAEVKALGGVEDHVHLVVRFPPTLAVAELVKNLKGSSSHLMTHDVASNAFFKWQRSYGAFTVGARALPAVCAYVLNQKEHHRLGTLIAAYELA